MGIAEKAGGNKSGGEFERRVHEALRVRVALAA
jgi:hypothetical protein